MYFYDLEDYCTSGFIGVNSVDFSLYGDWNNVKGTFDATRDAMVNALGQWYIATTVHKDPSVCQRCDQIKDDLFTSLTADTRIIEFWANAEDNNMVDLTQQQFNAYQDAMYEQMCLLKNLMNCLDGDTFSDYIPCNNNNCVTGVTTFSDFDLMDDPRVSPTPSEIDSWFARQCATCDFNELYPDYNLGGYDVFDYQDDYREQRDEWLTTTNTYGLNSRLGYCPSELTLIQPNTDLLNKMMAPTSPLYGQTPTWPWNFWSRGVPKKMKVYIPYKAYLHAGWYDNTGYTQSLNQIFSGYTDNVRYVKSVSDVSQLPLVGQAGDVIMVGPYTTASTNVTYAWNPNTSSWSTTLAEQIEETITGPRRQYENNVWGAVRNLVLSMKPLMWAGNYVLLHPFKKWPLQNALPVTGREMIETSGSTLPCMYENVIDCETTSTFCPGQRESWSNFNCD